MQCCLWFKEKAKYNVSIGMRFMFYPFRDN